MFTSIIKKIIFPFLVLLLHGLSLQGQSRLIDGYIAEAFRNNQGLRQKELNLDKAMYALKEARSYYLPNISFNGNYTKAGGGRTIDLPIGDLLNPAYRTLNTLTASNNFPQIENESVLLNPDNFYDAKIHTTLPLINQEIGYNKRIKQESITQQKAAVNVYKRELIKDIKTAYYHYYQAVKATEIYESSMALVNENIRVNESLLRNGARNATALTRSQSEKEKVEAAKNQQQNIAKNAMIYFNFLLNRDLNTPVILDTTHPMLQIQPGNRPLSYDAREELRQLQSVKNMYALHTKMQRSNRIPKLNTFVDLGSQAFNFNVNNKSLYYLGGLNLQWDLFAGNRNNLRIKQAETDILNAEAAYNETERAFAMQSEQVKNNLNTAVINHRSAATQVALSERYYDDQFKVYKEGQLLYIELVDAQNEMTNARLRLSVAEAAIQIALAEEERSQAAYPL